MIKPKRRNPEECMLDLIADRWESTPPGEHIEYEAPDPQELAPYTELHDREVYRGRG